MLLGKIRKFFGELKDDRSGNAMLLMALGMPILIGTSGMAVDFSQWYMWKRELQYAVDQAAIAGAWSKADSLSANDYVARSRQEFSANLSLLNGKTTTPWVGLVNYGLGTQNSVWVSSSTTQTLPFSNIMINSSVKVYAEAQATYEAATNYVVCMLAVDKTAVKGFIVGGSLSGSVDCGGGTLSTSSTAIVKNGSSSAQFGYFVAGGGIESGLSANGSVNANVSNLSDPYSGITPPSDTTTQTYSCPTSGSSSTSTPASSKTATKTTTVDTVYTFYQAKNRNEANDKEKSVEKVGDGAGTNSSVTTVLTDQDVDSGTYEGQTATTTTSDAWTGQTWTATTARNEEIYEWKKVTTTVTYSNVVTAGGSGTGTTVSTGVYTLSPGTYAGISIGCDTHFSPGVYTINGTLNFGSGHAVTGTDVMIVLQGTGSEKMIINDTSSVTLSGITKNTLIKTYGLSDEVASKLATMVLYDTTSTADLRFNGKATIAIDGTVYMPKRNGKFNGNSTVSGKCLILALATLEFTGDNTLGSFCRPNGSSGINLGGTTVQVRLVR